MLSMAASTGCATDLSGIADDPQPLGDASGDGTASDTGGAPGDDTATLDSNGPLPDGVVGDTFVGDTAGGDTAVTDTTIVDTAVAPDTKPPPSDVPTCDESACGSLPSGAKRVALVDRSVTCPAGFAPTDVVEVKGGDACACSCSGAPSGTTCPTVGTIPTWYSDASGCGTSGADLTAAGTGVCVNFGGGTLHPYFKAVAPGPPGGVCAAAKVTPDKAAITRQRRLCEPSGCAAAICGMPADCIETAAPCVAPYPNAHAVGSDLSVTCPGCSCAVTGTCIGTIDFWQNLGCTGPKTTVNADGACGTGATASVTSFKYNPKTIVGAGCGGTYATAPGTSTLAGQRNLCCK